MRTDVLASVVEPDTRPDNTSAPTAVTVASPFSDFLVEAVSAPGAAIAGTSVEVAWRVRNIGNAIADGSWRDRVVLSNDGIYDSTDIVLGTFNRSGPLATQETYTVRASFTLPLELTGSWQVLVRSDIDGSVFEGGRIGNDTGTAPAPLVIAPAPSANLVAGAVIAPAQALAGAVVSASWTITNEGEVAALGPWTDYVYFAPIGQLAGATLLGTRSRNEPLAVGANYSASLQVALPAVADTDGARLLVVTDAQHGVYESQREGDNAAVSNTLSLRHVDLQATAVAAPAAATSGDLVQVTFDVNQAGSTTLTGAWTDRLYLSSTPTVDGSARLLASRAVDSTLAAGASYPSVFDITIPVDVQGSWYLVAVSDALGEVGEVGGEGNNVAATAITVTLAPYADLAVSDVTAPARLIADPARITVGWTVRNTGTGAGLASSWTDRLVLSKNAVAGDNDDIVIGNFVRDTGLAQGASYSRSETVFAPASYAPDSYRVFVIADAGRQVFENGSEANNAAAAPAPLDLMPIPFADLVLTDLVVPATAQSGQSLAVSWAVRNDGIARTDRTSWSDTVIVSRNPDGSDVVAIAGFDHIGVLAAGDRYERSGSVRLPDALSGPVYVTVRTGGVFEFIHDDALNSASAGPVLVSQSPAPDLVVTSISAPTAANEGESIDITWSVRNDGVARAAGSWTDTVSLRKPGLDPADPATPKPIVLGSFTTTSGLDAGLSYTRTERFKLPARTEGGWQVVVSTDGGNTLFEGSPEIANNTLLDDEVLLLSLNPRPDLQVQTLTAPERVTAGSTAAVAFTVVNRGPVATATPRWVDHVYLSLDDKLGSDDILLEAVENGAALAKDAAYASTTRSIVIPERFRGPGFFIAMADAGGAVEEYPAANERNNIAVKAVFVEAQPLSDLVTGAVVVPAQAVYGGEITVRFTVTNKGSAATNRSGWTDTVWLTKDKTRPSPGPRSVLTVEGTPIVIPGNDAVLLGSFAHDGALALGESYTQEVKVRIPQQIDSGTWFITPWSDAYDAVFEDTLASNLNTDDPNEFDSNNYKARAIDILGTPVPPLPDLQVVAVSTNAGPGNPGSVDGPFTVTWTVRNFGEGVAIGLGGSWSDSVFLHETPDLFAPGARVWSLGSFERLHSLDPLASYTQTKSFDLSPATKGLYVTVIADTNPIVPFVIESIEDNNAHTATTEVVARPADLVVTSISAPAPQNFSGERTTVSWTVRNDGAAIWAGTRHWTDAVWLSPDPTFGSRAVRVGQLVHAAGDGLAHGESYTASTEIAVPAGHDGPYFLYVGSDIAFQGTSTAAEGDNGDNDRVRRLYAGNVYEAEASNNNFSRGTIDIIYREPDLTISDITVPPGPLLSGQDLTVKFTVSNEGTRDTREWRWTDRLYLSRDPSLDSADLQVASFLRLGPLGAGDSYERTATFQIPGDAEGPFYLIAFADSDVFGQEPGRAAATIGLGAIQVVDDAVPEFRDEGNNTTVQAVSVTLAPAADLRVTDMVVPERTLRGQALEFQYTVTNTGGAATPGAGVSWFDRIYLSADPLFDPVADRFIGQIRHEGVVAAHGGSYTVVTNSSPETALKLPRDLTGAYYVFVQTDPALGAGVPRGQVFEAGFEGNNVSVSPTPMLIELPPPSDLVITAISAPPGASTGEEVRIDFTVTNQAGAMAEGSWTDSIYLSSDGEWGLGDVLLGKVAHSGNLAVGASYSSQLLARLPPAKAGDYRIIVRSDIFNEVHEGADERNNATASAGTLALTVPALQLGVPLLTTLSPGQQRLFRVTVGAGETLSLALDGADDLSANELFVRYGDVASGFAFDFGASQTLSADPSTVVPATLAGDYYVLIQGRSGAAAHAPVKLTAKALPFSITDIVQDQGGDGRWVTTTISGARFKPGALVKLVRPGLVEVEPARFEVLDATTIIATFDLRNVPHGLYDVAVINPDGALATLPYRYLVEAALPIDVTIGLGGPRVVPAGQTGLYSVSLQSLTNVDTPYVHFAFGAPELGDNAKVFGLPYVSFNSNVRGAPDGQRTDVPWVSLDSEVNSGGFMLAPGYALDVTAGGFVGMSFSVTTYPGLKALYDRDFEAYKRALYDARPDLAKADVLAEGVGSLGSELAEYFSDPNAKLNDKCVALFMPFLFNVTAAATPMTRDEFVAEQTAQAQRLRSAVLADTEANAALINLAADGEGWVNAYLAALEDGGLLRPADEAPPIRRDPKVVSLLAVLGSGVLVGPAGREIASPSSLGAFFEQVHQWYGDTPGTIAPLIGYDIRISDECGEYAIPVPKVAAFEDFDLGLSHPTYFQSVNVFSPGAGAGPALTVDPGFSSLASSNTLAALDLQALFDQIARSAAGGATISGPSGAGDAQFVPVNTALPYTVRFANPAESSTAANEVRVVSVLDDDVSVRSFRLGDMQIGGVTIHVPAERANFQGDFDLRNSLGFIVRVSAGVDPTSRTASWVLQAIDPETGEVLQDATRGLLLPDNTQGRGAGFVSWTVQAAFGAATGAEISAQASVLLDNQAPSRPTSSRARSTARRPRPR
nr:CARDB domain-containing protein [Ramlibacter montanisoli]